jgi:hypothetical protein
MFKVLILVCSVALTPDECQADTAVAVIDGPEAPNEVMCGLNGQAYLAGTAMASKQEDEYVKVTCSRSTIGRTVG